MNPPPSDSTSEPIRIGLIGCGTVASYGHLPAIRDTPALALHAVFDVDAERVERVGRAFEAPHRTIDLDAFFDSGIAAVAITSPAPAHHANVLAAAERGLPILCEKPLAMTRDEADDMLAATNAAGVCLAVGFCYRFSPAAREIHALLRAGAIGEPRTLRLIYNWDCGGVYPHADPETDPDLWAVDRRRHGRMLEGGPMVDCGTHQIDLARWWLGRDATLAAGHGSWADAAGYDAPDHVWVHLDHPASPTAAPAHTVVEMSFSYGHTVRKADRLSDFRYELIGTEGLIRYDRAARLFERRDGSGTHRLEWHDEKHFGGMYAAFAEAVRTGEPGDLLCLAPDAMRVSELALQGTRDAMARRRAAFPGCTSAVIS